MIKKREDLNHSNDIRPKKKKPNDKNYEGSNVLQIGAVSNSYNLYSSTE